MGETAISAPISPASFWKRQIPKKNQVLFHDGVTSFMQLMVFFLPGLLCTVGWAV
ncbi:MAG: hypothetical protein ACLVK8_06865 [Ruminococcus sp.]